MPLNYNTDPKGPSQVRGLNPLTAADALASIEQQASSGAWSRPRLVDLRGVTWLPTTAEIHRFIHQTKHLNVVHGHRGPVVFVVDGHKALFGMLRMYSILADDVDDIDVFDSVDDAMPW